MKKKNNVVVGMSGGIDSSLAASILLSQGFNVIGVTLKLWDQNSSYLNSILDAQTVCNYLSIRHIVVDLTYEFKQEVVNKFCAIYLQGKTPNPCILCNESIKFGLMLKKTVELGADYLATGHYACIEKEGKKFFLKKAYDLQKDQSYFLYRLKQVQLKRIIFPLSSFTKAQIRQIALKEKLPVAQKADSQEICFIPDNDYRKFLAVNSPNGLCCIPGNITDMNGKVIGRHKGVCFYTIGQREGLGIALGYPAYIVNIDVEKNLIQMGKKDDVLRKEFIVGDLSFVNEGIKKKGHFNVKIRYNQKEAKACIWAMGTSKLKICFEKPQFAIAPGQSAVIYEQEKVLGGGIIERVVG